MTSTGVAPATVPTRTIVGPLCTSAGFQYWYLACFPDCIVAVPQGIWTGLMLGVSNSVAPHFGLLGGLLVLLLARRGQSMRTSIEATLQSMPDSRLRSKPNTVFLISQLRSIAFKGSKSALAGSLITPDIILETKSAGKRKYGIQGPDFEKACTQLRQLYPDLCKSL